MLVVLWEVTLYNNITNNNKHFLYSPPEKSLTPLLLHDSFLGREVDTFESYLRESLHM